MYLKKIEIQGFKSFANKTIIEFNPPQRGSLRGQEDNFKYGITAIVGPNGSGKSNIADAARWVLGEQSMKMIRGKKGEDVIFSGSDRKPRMGMAEVFLYLNNNDRQLPLDYDEVVIGRRLYRNGESEYLINKNKARLQDIVLMLAKANFAWRAYSIIAQGMIDAILLASPAERKDFFDEAAGIKQYQIKRDGAMRKLESSEENLKQAETVLAEIEPRVRSLTRQVRKLEKREEIGRNLKEQQKAYYGSIWHNLNNEYKIQDNKYNEAEKKRQSKENEVKKIHQELSLLEKEESRGNVFTKLQSEYEKLINEKNKFREQELLLKNKIEIAKRSNSKMPTIMPVSDIIDNLEKIDKLQEKLFERIKSAENLSDLESIQYQSAEIRDQIKELLEKLKNPKAKETKINPNLAKELGNIAEKIEELNQKIAQVNEKMNNFNKEEEQKRGKVFDLQREFQRKQMELNELTSRVNDIKIELARLETKKEDLEAEIKTELEDITLITANGANVNTNIKTEELWPEIQKLKHQLELIGGIDPETIDEYKETKERYDFLKTQSEDLRKAIKSLEKIIEELDLKIKKQFDESFNNINKNFEKYFRILFNGGRAQLIKITKEEEIKEEEVNQEDEEREILPRKKQAREKVLAGIEIKATPPGKKLKSIGMLSGGERALTSIALICAIMASNPSPFVILDEVDAALDESNSIRFAEIIDELSSETQFILITHNRCTMEKAGSLYGVTMGDDGVSKLLSIKLEEAEKAAA